MHFHNRVKAPPSPISADLKNTVRSVRALVEELHLLWRRHRAGEAVDVPLVTLHMESGRDVAGWLVNFADSGEGASVYLRSTNHLEEASLAPLLCVDFSRVEAITLEGQKRPKKIAAVVAPVPKETAPKISTPPQLPSKVAPVVPDPVQVEVNQNQIRRKLLSLEGMFASSLNTSVKFEVAWSTLLPTSAPLVAMKDFIDLLKRTVSDMAQTPSQRETLRRLFQIVRIESAASSFIQMESDVLRIGVPLNQGQIGYESEESLRDAIQSIY